MGNRSCVTGRRRILKVLACCLASLPLALCPMIGWAQTPATSITSSGLTTTVVPPSGPSTTTAIRGGTLSPDHANLFHSFGEFSIGQGDTAAFHNLNADGTAPLAGSAASVANIIGRVTGASPSSIYGTINSQSGFPNANLFLINPRGIVFGPGAALQVGGAVHFSTADYLRMGTGSEFFYADLARSSTLSSAPVTAFGFLGASPAGTQAIELRDGTHLSLAPDQDLSLVGRDTMSGTESVPGIRMTQGRITAPGGTINVVSVGTPLDPIAGGEVSAADVTPASASSGHGFATLGRVHMADNAFLSVSNVSGPAVGQLVIRGGQLTMEGGSRLLARTTDSNTVQGGIDIEVTEVLSLRGNSSIDSQVVGNAGLPGSDIRIQAGSLTVTEGSQIMALNTSGHPDATGGTIDITAGTVTLSGAIDGGGATVQSGLSSGTTRTATGPGGRIRLVTGDLSIQDGAAIDTSTFSSADAGAIEITATRLLVSDVNTTNGITNASSTISSRATWDRQAGNSNEQGNTGRGGNILIQAATLDLHAGGQVNTSTETAGDAGSIGLIAETINIAGGAGVQRSGLSTTTSFSGSGGGRGGSIDVTAASLLDLSDGAAIALDTAGAGTGGTLTMQAGSISLTGESRITSGADSSGAAGNLSLTSGSLAVQNSTISTRTFGAGQAGTIAIAADNVTMSGPTARIDSSTNTISAQAGSGGSVIVTAGHTLTVQGGTITTSTSSAGQAGTVQLSGPQIILTGGEVLGSTTSNGAGGTVTVTATGPAGSVLINGGSIRASTSGSGQAGNLVVEGTTVSVLGVTSTIQTNTTGAGNAGSIVVQAGHLTLADGGAISSASLAQATGNAGSVSLSAASRFLNSGGHVTTSADSGLGGDITIRSNEIELNGGATIAANTGGLLDAGHILLAADSRIMLDDSSVITSASQASGGNITLLARDLVRLRNGQIVSSVQGGPGTSGGDIMIDPQAVLLQHNSRILAQAFQGNGGNISLVAGVLIVEPGSLIDASSQLGLSGQVSLQAPIQSLASVVMPLPQSFVTNANLYGQRCAARKGGQFSSFVQGVRDGLPPEPGSLLSSPLPSRLAVLPSRSGGPSPSTLMAQRFGFDDAFVPRSARWVLTFGCRS